MTIADQRPPATPAPAPKRRSRRWWKILLGLVILLIVLVLLAPTLLSTGPGRGIILGQVNKRIAGSVAADSISLGWFSGTSVRNLVVSDPAGKPVVTVPSIETGLTLASAVRQSFRGLNVVARVKSIDIVTDAAGNNNLKQAFANKSATPAAPATTAPSSAASSEKSAGGSVNASGTLDLQIDQVTCTSPNAPVLHIDNTVAKGHFDTMGGTTDMTLSAQAKAGDGKPATLAANMAGNFFENGTLRPTGELAGKGDASIQSLDLAAVTPLLQAAGIKLQLTGTEGNLKLDQVGGKQAVTGNLTIDQLVATGEMLKGDTLRRNKVTATLDAAPSGQTVDVRKLALATDALTANVSGTVKTSPEAGEALPPVTITATVDVAALKAELPHLLANVPDTTASVNLTGRLNSAKKVMEITTDSSLAEKDPKSGRGNTIALSPGTVLSWGDLSNDVRATVTYSLERVQQLMADHLPTGTTLAGSRTVKLHVMGAVGKEAGLAAFKGFQIDPTAFGFDQITCKGLTLGKADVGIGMKSGVLALTPTDVPANGGTIHLAGHVDFTQNPPAFVLEKAASGTQLVKNVGLNHEIAAGPLSFLPLAWGSGDKSNPNLGEVTGQLNITVQSAFIPLDSAVFKQKGATQGTLNIANLTTNAPLFSQLLGALGPLAKISQPDILNIRGGQIPDTPFALSDGKVTYQNLTIGTNKGNVQFSGAVGTDNSLAMSVQVTAGSLKIPIPIGLGGTTSKPQLTFAGGGAAGKGDQTPAKQVQDLLPGGLDQLLNRGKKK